MMLRAVTSQLVAVGRNRHRAAIHPISAPRRFWGGRNMTDNVETSVRQLSAIVCEGLRSLNTDIISPELTKKVITNAVKMALHSNVPGNPEIYAHRADHTKQAEYAILALMFVALQHGWDGDHLRAVLEHRTLAVAPAASAELVAAYATHQADLYVHSLTTGPSLPHLTDVEWKLTCDVRTSQLAADLADGSGGAALNYTVSLGRFQVGAGGERESIATFQCNVEELQSLVGKLKDAERHLDRLARDKC